MTRSGHGRRRSLAWLVALLPLVAGCTLFSPRPKALLRTTFRITPRSTPPGSDDFEADMNRVTGTDLTRGNRCTLLVNGEQAFPAMQAAIRQARRRISWETYILRIDESTRPLLAALTDAARRGVKVRFLCDAFGSRTIDRSDLSALIAAGGEVRLFNKFKAWTVVRANNRDHRKILVVDGRVGFLGGLNLAREYDGDGRTGWRDTHLRIEGPAAAAAERVFAQSWMQGGTGFLGKDLPMVGTRTLKRTLDEPLMRILGMKSFAPTERIPPIPGGVPARVVASSPERIDSPVLDMYLLAINSSRRRVWITCGYFVPPLLLTRALREAAQRGVDVRLMLQGKTDEPTTRMISLGYYGKLLEAGVKLYEWEDTILHAKTAVVDGVWSTVGSANLDGRALFLNYEANVAVTDPALAGVLEAQFRQDLKRCRAVTLTDWRHRSLKQKAGEWMLAPVKGQF